MNKNLRIQLSIILYLIFISILIVVKPTHIYKKDGSLKTFGTGKHNTIFPLWLMIFVGAFLSYYLSLVILVIYSMKKS